MCNSPVSFFNLSLAPYQLRTGYLILAVIIFSVTKRDQLHLTSKYQYKLTGHRKAFMQANPELAHSYYFLLAIADIDCQPHCLWEYLASTAISFFERMSIFLPERTERVWVEQITPFFLSWIRIVLGQVSLSQQILSSWVFYSRTVNQELNVARQTSQEMSSHFFSKSGMVSKEGNLGRILYCLHMH